METRGRSGFPFLTGGNYWETVVVWMHKYMLDFDNRKKKSKNLDLMVFFLIKTNISMPA